MSKQRAFTTRMILLGAAALGIGYAFSGGQPGTAGTPAAAPPPAKPVAGRAAASQNRPDDREALGKALNSFAAAFTKDDGKAVAAHWTGEGEYISNDGTTFRGRAELEKAYTEYFNKNPDNVMTVEVESIRFPSKDSAVAEGFMKLHRGKKKELVVSRCSFLFVREDGKWRIAIAREWRGDGLSLRDMEWLIGKWEAKRNGAVVATRYEWTANKSFIRCNFSITRNGKTTIGMQMIGKDPTTGLLRVWTFEDGGGIGEAAITRDGKKWIHTARGATADGSELTTTNILTPIDHDSFLWQAVDRTLDDEELPDLPPIKVTRVKAKP